MSTTGDIVTENSKAAWDSTAGVRERASESANNIYIGAGEITMQSWEKTKEVGSSVWDKASGFFSFAGSKASEALSGVKDTGIYKSGTHKVSSVKQLANIFGWIKSNEDVEQRIEEIKENEQIVDQ